MKPGYTANGLKEFREVRHIPEPIYAMLPDEPELEDGIFFFDSDGHLMVQLIQEENSTWLKPYGKTAAAAVDAAGKSI